MGITALFDVYVIPMPDGLVSAINVFGPAYMVTATVLVGFFWYVIPINRRTKFQLLFSLEITFFGCLEREFFKKSLMSEKIIGQA